MMHETQSRAYGTGCAWAAVGVAISVVGAAACGGDGARVHSDASADAAPFDGAVRDGAPPGDAGRRDAVRPHDSSTDASTDGGATERCRGAGLMAFEQEDESGSWVTSVRAEPDGTVTVFGDPLRIADSTHPTAIEMAADGRTAVVALKRDPPAVVLLSLDETCAPHVRDRRTFPRHGPPTGVGFGYDGRVLVPAFENPLGSDDAAVVAVLEITDDGALRHLREVTVREGTTNVSSDPFAGLAAGDDGRRVIVPNTWDGEDRATLLEWNDAEMRYETRGFQPVQLASHKAAVLSPDGTDALVTESSRVAAFSIGKDGLGAPSTLDMDGTTAAVAFVPGHRRALVAAYDAHEVRLVELGEGGPVDTGVSASTGSETQESPDDIAISPFANLALVANRLGHDVARIEIGTGKDGTLTYLGDLAVGVSVANAPIRLTFVH